MKDYITFKIYTDNGGVFKSEVIESDNLEPNCSAELMDQFNFITGE